MAVKSSRRKYTAEFKTKVALEALKERMTVSEMSKRHEIHPNLIMQWKKTFMENGVRIFEESHPSKEDPSGLIESLYREIGCLTMEVIVLKKKLSHYK
jgi:transposase-like protein